MLLEYLFATFHNVVFAVNRLIQSILLYVKLNISDTDASVHITYGAYYCACITLEQRLQFQIIHQYIIITHHSYA